ncbi:hypothetical protein F5I97DRAFT_1001564 [Phlebopus sp. FC_14]|nr:hypothetical protein F5I97DRAFT_1001564 [Phlebopus sp. FC_14]
MIDCYNLAQPFNDGCDAVLMGDERTQAVNALARLARHFKRRRQQARGPDLALRDDLPAGLRADAVPPSRNRRCKQRPKIIIPSPTEQLESFIDKLFTWQLRSYVAKGTFHQARNQWDWMQSFCVDVRVGPQ